MTPEKMSPEQYEKMQEEIQKRREENAANKERALACVEVIKEVAAKYNDDLENIVKEREGYFPEEIIEGPVTTKQLVNEFEALARERGLNPQDFYDHGGTLTIVGKKAENLAFMQIFINGSKQDTDQGEGADSGEVNGDVS